MRNIHICGRVGCLYEYKESEKGQMEWREEEGSGERGGFERKMVMEDIKIEYGRKSENDEKNEVRELCRNESKTCR